MLVSPPIKNFGEPPIKNNTFRSYKSKYLSNGTWWIVTRGVIRDQLAELYILEKEISILDKKNFLSHPLKNNTSRSYKSKYLSNGTWWIVTTGVILPQLAELYILKKNSIFHKKFF